MWRLTRSLRFEKGDKESRHGSIILVLIDPGSEVVRLQDFECIRVNLKVFEHVPVTSRRQLKVRKRVMAWNALTPREPIKERSLSKQNNGQDPSASGSEEAAHNYALPTFPATALRIRWVTINATRATTKTM